MRHAALIYNPESGRKRARVEAAVHAASAEFRAAGVNATAIATTAPGSAADQVREALSAGCDSVLVCGGDGTVNDALQALVGSAVPLGIVPLGTGNVIATYIGIPRDPRDAARALLKGAPRTVGVAKITSAHGTRFFLAAAGVGADAHIMYRAIASKPRLGLAAYYLEGLKMFFTHRFPPFVAEFTDTNGKRHIEIVSQVVAARVGSFPGLLRDIVPGAGFDRDDLRVLLILTPNRIPYLMYMSGVLFRRVWQGSPILLSNSREIRCRDLTDTEALPPAWRRGRAAIHAEIDGDPVARLPVTLSIAGDSIQLIFPS